MPGILFALLGGACLMLQGVANARIGHDIGVWQTAALTQLTGFLVALAIAIALRESAWHPFRQVKPLYLTGGALGAVIVFSSVTAVQQIGVTMTVAVLLIAQLSLTVLVDLNGWFGVVKQAIRLPQFIGIAMMIAGVVMLRG
ncbi:DMT family transporter [bacterium]|nr:DMT family transporter [bacterium]